MILKASNLSLTDGQESARLVADSSATATTLTVDNISGFSVGKYLLIGEFGDSNAEIVRIHTSTAPTGSTVTLNAGTTKDHYADTKITVIDYNQIEFSRATTISGSKVVLTTKNISADRVETNYTDATNLTGFAFFRFKDEANSVFSQYSSGVSYAGTNNDSVQNIVDKACRDAGVKVGEDFSTEDMLLDDANDCQDAICDTDWKFELVKNDTSLTVSQYENTFSLDNLSYELKYKGIVQGVKSVKLSGHRLDYIDNDEMDTLYNTVVRTTVATQAEIGDTSIVLSNTSELPDNGTVYINGLSLTYSTNTKSTNTLSGISAASITKVLPVSSNVWYNITTGLPTKYTITIENEILFNVPIATTYNGYSVTIEYLKKLSRFTDFASVTEIPFSEIMPLYVSAKIEKRKRNMENYTNIMAEFKSALEDNKEKYKIPVLEDGRYYNFFNTKIK